MTSEARLKVIIVEDEEKDRKVIERILSDYYPHMVTIVESCPTVDEAVAAIASHHPDLVFLDIVIRGNRHGAFDILERVTLDFQIIFITGNNDMEYYSKAIKLHCLDYIIKPTSIEDFSSPLTQAWEKKRELQQHIEREKYIKHLENFIEMFKRQQTDTSIPIPVEFGHIIVRADNIIKCQSNGNYTEFFLTDSTKKIANGNLKHFEEMLAGYNIVRVHRQCMVNLLHITSYTRKEGGMITLSNGYIVYVGETWRDNFETMYNNFFGIRKDVN